MSRLVLLALLALAPVAGCGDKAPDTGAAPTPQTAAPVGQTPATPAGPTVAERRARYDGRPTVALPAELPGAWTAYAKALDGKVIEARHEVRSTHGRDDWRAVRLRIRVFGLDGGVLATVHGALAGLELPGLPALEAAGEDLWRGQAITAGPVQWSVDIGRLVAPPGEPREQIVELRWRRTPPDPESPRACRKPEEVPAPAASPGWLTRTTSKRTTRRRVTAAVQRDPKGTTVELRMLFHNGLAHDEHVRHLAEAAARAGFTREGTGEGARQRWIHPDGATFAFDPDTRDDLGLGCTLAGPVLSIRLVTPTS